MKILALKCHGVAIKKEQSHMYERLNLLPFKFLLYRSAEPCYQ